MIIAALHMDVRLLHASSSTNLSKHYFVDWLALLGPSRPARANKVRGLAYHASTKQRAWADCGNVVAR